MGKLIGFIIAAVFGGSALAFWACIAMAGECSRKEEKRDG